MQSVRPENLMAEHDECVLHARFSDYLGMYMVLLFLFGYDMGIYNTG
jgi:hypothetical protein